MRSGIRDNSIAGEGSFNRSSPSLKWLDDTRMRSAAALLVTCACYCLCLRSSPGAKLQSEFGLQAPDMRICGAIFAVLAAALRIPSLGGNTAEPAIAPWGGLTLLGGMLALALSSVLSSSALSHIFLQTAGGAMLAWSAGNARVLRAVAPSLAVLAMPVLLQWAEHSITIALRELATEYCLYFDHHLLLGQSERDGFRLVLISPVQNQLLLVAPECSGIRSLFGLTMLAFALACHPSYTLMRRTLLIVIGMAAAIVGNLVRLSATVGLYRSNYAMFAQGPAHSALSQLIFCIEGTGLYWCFRGLLQARRSQRGIDSLTAGRS